MDSNEFKLKVIEAVAKSQFGVKVREDGSVLLDVLGYMQSDGTIAEYRDDSFDVTKFEEYVIGLRR